ncbi:RibD family protein [Fodinicurvata sp. EGI_FJ10296]|uniref:RibD family protein n=1 Tax=Fodinicurvata sp. EGI_FJ10296 TaxID=3231908 RepID=UPI003452381E
MPDVTKISAVWSALLEADRRRREGCDRAECIAAFDGRTSRQPTPSEASALKDMFLPIVLGGAGSDREPGGIHVIAQMGMSLDGRIATESGHSHYINGPENIVHLHRLRALSDAVIVGAETVVTDDARLTTRLVDGPDPVRVILDPRGRVPSTAAAVTGAGGTAIVLTGPDVPRHRGEISGQGSAGDPRLGRATVCRMSEAAMTVSGGFHPAAVIDHLAARGLSRLFVEGGGRLVSAFLAAGCLDRIHVCVAPMIIGSGRPGLVLPPIDRLDGAIRAPAAIYRQGADVLFDLDLREADGRGQSSR